MKTRIKVVSGRQSGHDARRKYGHDARRQNGHDISWPYEWVPNSTHRFPSTFYILHFTFYILPLLLFSGCAYYSFTGASIPENLNTIAIPLVVDNSLSTIPSLGDELTERLVNRFVRQTRLSLAPNEDEADALLAVEIQRYTNAPSSVSGDERAARNRVTISVSVVYTDQDQEEELLSRTFSNFEEYDPLNLDDEVVAALAALDNLADDIFTAATSNW